MNAWLYLLVAGLLEMAWPIGLKYTEGWTRLWPSLLTLLTSITSFYFLAQALRSIPVGTGYAIWSGLGAVGTATLGMLIFGEPMSTSQLGCLLLIVTGIVGLKWTASE